MPREGGEMREPGEGAEPPEEKCKVKTELVGEKAGKGKKKRKKRKGVGWGGSILANVCTVLHRLLSCYPRTKPSTLVLSLPM